jgi:hypothetical protein
MTVRRLKTYASSFGYVYQYYFAGQRKSAESDAVEYVFEVSRDGAHSYPVGIVLPQPAVAVWASTHQRDLSDSERYAAAKLRLFRAFDDIENLEAGATLVHIEADFLEESLAALGVG